MMSSTHLFYQKGDLVTMKQSCLVFEKTYTDKGIPQRKFWRLAKPLSGVFLGFAPSQDEDFRYLQDSASMKTPCRIAVGESIYYVDEKSFFFHTHR